MGVDGFNAIDFVDLVLTCRAQTRPDKRFVYLLDPTVHRHELLNHLLLGNKRQIEGGEYIDRWVNYRETGTAQYVLPGKIYQPSISASMKKLQIGWAHANANWSFVREEVRASRDPVQLADHLMAREMATEMDLALLMEKQLWAAPAVADTTLPYGLAYWIVPITGAQVTTATTLSGAFQGANPTDFSDCGGIDASDDTYARWRNWNFQWSNLSGVYTSQDEENLGSMFRHLQFESPILVKDLETPRFASKRIYINETTLKSCEQAMKGQNDNIGSLGKFTGATTFKSMPLVWIDQLDTYSAAWGYYPVVMANLDQIYPVTRTGEMVLRQTFGPDKYQPDTTTTHLDIDYNTLCENRQAVGGVGSYVAAA